MLSTLSVPAGAITIQYEARDLPDTTEGADHWQFTYRVSDYTFNAGHGFTIFFNHRLYREIEEPISVSDDWDIQVWQPDVVLPSDGAYDALAMTSNVDGASLAGGFTVSFIWVAQGTPGSQSFEVYDSNFKSLESGKTWPIWDVNCDGKVDLFDLVIVGGEFGQSPPVNHPRADVNADGTVNIFDLVQVGRHFGETSRTLVAVPNAPQLSQLRLNMRKVTQRLNRENP